MIIWYDNLYVNYAQMSQSLTKGLLGAIVQGPNKSPDYSQVEDHDDAFEKEESFSHANAS